jgi:hypothetical protein
MTQQEDFVVKRKEGSSFSSKPSTARSKLFYLSLWFKLFALTADGCCLYTTG